MGTSNETISMNALKQFTSAYPVRSFRPLAYYDKHLDCIRVQVKDCSFKEERINRFFTLWYDNHPGMFQKNVPVGFTIKGVKHLFVTLGLPKTGPIYVAQIIDAMLKLYPDQTMSNTIEQIRRQFKDNLQLPVSELPDEPQVATL
jgi:hypothetical protein